MLSTRSQNALCFLLALAESPHGTLVSLQEITTREGLPHAYLEQILPTLRKSGLVSSQRGAWGGYKLSRPAEDISVWDVVSPLEKKKKSTKRISPLIKKLFDSKEASLRSISIASLSAEQLNILK